MTADVQSTVSPLAPTEVATPEQRSRFSIPPELVPDFTNIDIETEEPVESWLAEHLYRLLTEPLYASWPGPGEGRPFIVSANVGLFYKWKAPSLVPDVMLSLDVAYPVDSSRKEHNTYVVWELGKIPDVVIEIVSDRRGGEAGLKKQKYADMRIPYYAFFDPYNILGQGMLQCFEHPGKGYLPRPDCLFPDVGLGLVLWEGTYQKYHRQYIRWCDLEGHLILTGEERAEQERQRVERLEAQLRSLGVNPST